MAKKPKYPHRVYSSKEGAERAKKRYGGKGTKKVDIKTKTGGVRGYGIRW